MEFLIRTSELAMLRRRLAGNSAEFLVIYGRRRVGKTQLLGQLASDTRAFFFAATDTVPSQQLRDLTDELARVWGNDLLRAQPLTSREAGSWNRSPRVTRRSSTRAIATRTRSARIRCVAAYRTISNGFPIRAR